MISTQLTWPGAVRVCVCAGAQRRGRHLHARPAERLGHPRQLGISPDYPELRSVSRLGSDRLGLMLRRGPCGAWTFSHAHAASAGALYPDEGSAYTTWYDNVVSDIGSSNWLLLWTSSIHNVMIRDNFADTPTYVNQG